MKKPKFLSVMVVASLLLCVLYGVAAFLFQYITGEELSPTLTDNWYQVFGVEIAGTTIIYMTKRITSILKIEDKIKLKKDNGFEPKESDFDGIIESGDAQSMYVEDDPTYESSDDTYG